MISESLKINTTLTELWLSCDEVEENKNKQYKLEMENKKERKKRYERKIERMRQK